MTPTTIFIIAALVAVTVLCLLVLWNHPAPAPGA
jgi:hypothetical protein